MRSRTGCGRSGPGRRGPRLPAAALLIPVILVSFACARRAAVVTVPSGGIESVAGSGHARLRGRAYILKGRFAFVFRASGQGRIEAFDPFGRTVFILLTDAGGEILAVPSRRIYARGPAGSLAARFFGLDMTPRELVGLLCGRPDAQVFFARSGWTFDSDGQGRLRRGGKDGFAFEVLSYFGSGRVPRELSIPPGGPGRLTFDDVRFNPPFRPDAFDAGFLARFAEKPIEELEGMIDRED